MTPPPKVLLFGQALVPDTAELAKRCADELGPTWVFTDERFELGAPSESLKRFDAPSYDNSSIRTRIRTWMAYMRAAMRFSKGVEGRPVVFMNSNPPMLALVGYVGARLRERPYVVRVLDVYPDVMVQRGMFGARHPISLAWRAFNRMVYSRAAAVVTLGEVMAERVTPYMRDPSRLHVIPTSVNTASITPLSKADNWFAEEHGLTDRLVILYSGNYGASHDLSGLIDAMGTFGTDSGVTVLFIGGAGRAEELKEAASQRPEVCRYLPFQPAEVLPYSMTSGDIAVVTLGKGTEGISMPSKCYYMMAAGCAILGLSEGDNDLKRVIERYDCGVNLSCSDSDGIAKAIQGLRDDPETLARYQRNARRAAEEVFDTHIVTAQHFELLRALTD
ncbi:MAG: glycosyltransferase family 4 protein [Myxococcota bacterium]